MQKKRNKIVLIGWDAADWEVILPLIEQGKMPALKGLMERGTFGRLKTLDPPLSPMLWTTIATGVRADRHGICGFVEPSPDGNGLRPVTSTSRKVRALWNIFTLNDLKSNVVAWWPSNPAEKINGVMVSNLYQMATKPIEEEWIMPEGTVHPEGLIDDLKEWRVHPHEITPSMILPFVPNIEHDQELRKDKRVSNVIKVLANAASVHAASTYLQKETEWDFMAVYHDAIDHFCHIAMKYHPPRRKFIPEKDFEDFHQIVEAGYRFHDMMLERTLSMLDDDTTVILLSDHGFYADHRRPITLPKEPSGPAAEHSPYGILVMAGPGIKKGGQEITGASVIDITPTVLALAGLPVGKDMEGKVLQQCFSEHTSTDFIESWEAVEGFCGMPDKNEVEDPWAAQEALQQLVELGYIEAIEDDKLKLVEKSKFESEYYRARNMIDGGRINQAIPILEDIFKQTQIVRYGQRLAFAYLTLRKFSKVESLIIQLRKLEEKEFIESKSKVASEGPNDAFLNREFEEPLYLDYIDGLYNLLINKQLKALRLLEIVQEKNANSFELPLNIAKIHLLRKNFQLAEKQYIKALAIDGKSAAAHHGLGVCYLRQGLLNNAIDEFLEALASNFYMPNVHFHLGEALFRSNLFHDAAKALELAIQLSPGMTKARKMLLELYRGPLEDSLKCTLHENFLKNNMRGQLILVTGLEGAGFQRVLELLKQEGVALLHDETGITKSNRKEHELNKLKNINQWSAHSIGNGFCAVYLNVQSLPLITEDLLYKVIVVDRNKSDILVEQQHFLEKKNQIKNLPLKHFTQIEKMGQLLDAWIDSRPDIPTITIHYEELVRDEKLQLSIIKDYIGL